MTQSNKAVVVSGYYGFDNLGDEAILERLVSELTEYVARRDIIVLSQNPARTESLYGVRAINRWKLLDIYKACRTARLFISGGGGLFQDKSSVKSVIYYGGLINMARLAGAPVLVYAQGLGPLVTGAGRYLTRAALSRASRITLRDPGSATLAESWGLSPTLTGDPVWLLEKSESNIAAFSDNRKTLALSLRDGGGFDDKQIELLARVLREVLGDDWQILPLSLQTNQDDRPLALFCKHFEMLGGLVQKMEKRPDKPSQWLELIGRCDYLLGMRLHALIMALAQGLPVCAIAYDTKVKSVMESFGRPDLPYPGDDLHIVWQDILRRTLAQTARERDKEKIRTRLESVKAGSRINIQALSEMLGDNNHQG